MITLQGVMVPVDFSRESLLAAKFAASLAQEYNTKLYVLHVVEEIPYGMRLLADSDAYIQKAALQAWEDILKVIPKAIKEQLTVEDMVEVGNPHNVIVEKAKELGVDVIVIATKGRTALANILLGSVAEKVIRHAPCPVFVIRNPKDKFVYGWE